MAEERGGVVKMVSIIRCILFLKLRVILPFKDLETYKTVQMEKSRSKIQHGISLLWLTLKKLETLLPQIDILM